MKQLFDLAGSRSMFLFFGFIALAALSPGVALLAFPFVLGAFFLSRDNTRVKVFLRSLHKIRVEVMFYARSFYAIRKNSRMWRFGMMLGILLFILMIAPVAASTGGAFAMGHFIYDLYNELTTVTVAHIAARTSTLTTSGVDLIAYQGKIKLHQIIGTVSGTNPTWDGKIQDSADNSSFADVSGLTFTQVTASDSVQSIAIDTRSVRRYIRYVGTIGGTNTPTFASAVIFEAQKKVQ